MKKTILFVATTPFAVNAFLRSHLLALSGRYVLILCVNTKLYPLSKDIADNVLVIHHDIERRISPLSDLKALISLFWVFCQVRPDVVHSITPKAGLLSMLAARFARVKYRLHTFTGQVWANRSGMSRIVLKRFDRILALLASSVFADSSSQCAMLVDEGIVQKSGISILGPGSISGVDLSRFHPDQSNYIKRRQDFGVDANACVFLFVGRLVKDKGIVDLLHAFKILSEIIDDIELWVVGPDEDGLLITLKKICVGCVAPIRWFESTATPEIFMSSADVLVLPSYREGFGSVVIESAACGTPAIVTDITGLRDSVNHDETGMLVKVGQPNELANAMRMLAEDRLLLSKLGERARETVKKRFDQRIVTAAWIEYYERLLLC